MEARNHPFDKELLSLWLYRLPYPRVCNPNLHGGSQAFRQGAASPSLGVTISETTVLAPGLDAVPASDHPPPFSFSF